ncbi:MAG: hypothetical protein NXI21_01510 [Alphaproteobacteria bacterium]|nr:hypothetical protein [Alphaproteobacteria bacterium]
MIPTRIAAAGRFRRIAVGRVAGAVAGIFAGVFAGVFAGRASRPRLLFAALQVLAQLGGETLLGLLGPGHAASRFKTMLRFL